MPKKKRSTPDEFQAVARKEFGYLVSEFGFEEDEDRRKHMAPRSICFSSPVSAVTVEGIEVTMNVQVTVTCLGTEGAEPARVSLSAIVAERAPEARLEATDLLAQMAHDAALLRQHGADLLRGGANALAEARRIAEQQAQKNANKNSTGVS
jgi:hypothetical protein